MLDLETIENLSTVTSYVYTLLQEEPTPALDLTIEAQIIEVLSYLYRDDIPCELEKPMAMAIVSNIKASTVSNGLQGDITSYSEGDLSISFGNATSTGIKYGGRLERFKLVRGVFDV